MMVRMKGGLKPRRTCSQPLMMPIIAPVKSIQAAHKFLRVLGLGIKMPLWVDLLAVPLARPKTKSGAGLYFRVY